MITKNTLNIPKFIFYPNPCLKNENMISSRTFFTIDSNHTQTITGRIVFVTCQKTFYNLFVSRVCSYRFRQPSPSNLCFAEWHKDTQTLKETSVEAKSY